MWPNIGESWHHSQKQWYPAFGQLTHRHQPGPSSQRHKGRGSLCHWPWEHGVSLTSHHNILKCVLYKSNTNSLHCITRKNFPVLISEFLFYLINLDPKQLSRNNPAADNAHNIQPWPCNPSHCCHWLGLRWQAIVFVLCKRFYPTGLGMCHLTSLHAPHMQGKSSQRWFCNYRARRSVFTLPAVRLIAAARVEAFYCLNAVSLYKL